MSPQNSSTLKWKLQVKGPSSKAPLLLVIRNVLVEAECDSVRVSAFVGGVCLKVMKPIISFGANPTGSSFCADFKSQDVRNLVLEVSGGGGF